MGFNSIIGHDEIKSQLEKAINMGTLSHAHIISGEDGIGKSIIARTVALKILEKEIDKPYADIIEWRTEKNKTSIGVNAIRELIDEINKKPYEGDKKVIIIYDAHKMTVQAQNAFLKTIEEPPKNVFMILLCENLEQILDTIKSRCQIHKLKNINAQDMKRFLNIRYTNIEKDYLDVLVSLCDGIPGKAEKLVENSVFKEIRETTLEILLKINSISSEELLKYEGFLVNHKEEWQDIFICFTSYIRDTIIYKEVGDENLIINIDKIINIKELANMFSFNQLSDIIELISETKRNLDRNVNSALAFDVMLLKIQDSI